MNRKNAVFAALCAAALSAWALPALALAQAQQGAPSAPAPMERPSGGAGWLWIVAAIVVLAILFWAINARRRRTIR